MKKIKQQYIENCNCKNIDLCYLLDFSFLTTNDYKKLKRILGKYFYNNTPFGKMIDKNKTELLKKIYLKIKK